MSAEPEFTTSAIVASTASASHVLKIDGYSRTKGLAVGVHLRSCSFLVGGHSWHLAYLPNGDCAERSDYISMYLVLDGIAPGGGPVLAQFSISLLDRAGRPAPTYSRTGTTNQFGALGAHWGFPAFIRREVLEKSRHLNVKDDSFCVRCDITVVTEFRAEDAASIAAQAAAAAAPAFVVVPPPDLSRNLGHLLLSEQGADVFFRVDGEDFPAHRCVLAARSPVFQAELFGTMKEASSDAQCAVEIHDMRADVFKNLLHFVYTDSLPEPEAEETRDEEALMAQHLLVAADRYDMERLKLMCEDTLCRHIEVSNAATTLALAEQHRCQGLKDACFQFLKTPGVLNAVMATEDFDHLAISCPALIKELMSKLAAR
jgi:speckle-type POZ protein